MKIALFCHSLASCWNHGNAHFLRGVMRELQWRGHVVRAFEPKHGWSRTNLLADHGPAALDDWRQVYPDLRTETYEGALPDLDEALDGVDLVLMHEWNAPELIAAVGRRRAAGGPFVLLFHDTHHRAASDPAALAAFDLDGYDGVLAFGAALRERYLSAGWARRAWVWHEAADTSVFRPLPEIDTTGDLVWIGNWGDGERSDELKRFLLGPVRRFGLDATVYGVRYPQDAVRALSATGASYRGWLPNHLVPQVFARHRATVHVPRRPYAEALPGIPTIRVFEALASGIPLISAPWNDIEGLFPAGCFLVARDEEAMARHLWAVLCDSALRIELATRGLEAIHARHSCAHRVDQLLAIHAAIGRPPSDTRTAEARACA
jgi:spore maturation protein CgeB